MSYFIFSGKKKIRLSFPRTQDVTFLHPDKTRPKVPGPSLTRSIQEFIVNHRETFAGKRVCIVIPDNTRTLPSPRMLSTFTHGLRKLSARVEFMISLGLHKRLSPGELQEFLGRDFCGKNPVRQHDPDKTAALGTIGGVPATLNQRLLSYDALITIGIVEPHLYAGFSGGVKCIGIGLAGRETILATHSVEYLSRPGVQVANLRDNPFQEFLWGLHRKLDLPVYSCNLVLNQDKKIIHFSIGEAGESFAQATRNAREVYSHPVKEEFDLLFVGCDSPKDRNLYQASRLFNYVLEKKPLVRKGGAVFVFADLEDPGKSQAERNFEKRLQIAPRSAGSGFSQAGEHRAFKVIQASETVRCCVITQNPPKGRFNHVSFFQTYQDAFAWGLNLAGDRPKIGIIPLGFSFIPVG